MSDDWKKRIQGMLNTAANSGATEGERNTAMRMATKLMAKYGFNADDFKKEDGEFDFENAAFVKRKVVIPASKTPWWMVELANFVSDFVGGVFHYKTRDGNKAARAFYGAEESVLTACEIFMALAKHIKFQANFGYNGWQRGKGASFAQGFVVGLETQLRKEIARIEQHNEGLPPGWQLPGLMVQDNALIAQLDAWARDKLKSKYDINLVTNSRSSGGSLDGAAFNAGKALGSKHSAGGSVRKKLT